MAYVQTTAGVHVNGMVPGKADGYTLAQAEASAAERNARAVELGIKTRYEVVGE